ncbi:hypothetical protein FRB94_005515 [Tulasnella sp. JGI-2019a]|nr:hypothetical protein FRB94_005515 [Tulasnella sp. JGI-2019a]
MPTDKSTNAVAGPSQRNPVKHKKSSTNPLNTKNTETTKASKTSKSIRPKATDDAQPPPKSSSKSATYAKVATDFQNNRKQKAPKLAKPAQTTTGQAQRSTDDLPALEKKTVFRTTLDNPYQIEWPSVSLNVENGVLACVIDMLDGVAMYAEQRDLESKRRRKKARDKKSNTRQKVRKAGKANPDEASADTTNTRATAATEPAEPPLNPEGAGRKRKRDDGDEDATQAEKGKKPNPQDQTRDSIGKPPSKKLKTLPNPSEGGTEVEGSTTGDPEDVPPKKGTETDPPGILRPTILDHAIMGINEVTKRLERQSAALRQPANAEMKHPSVRLVVVCRTDMDSPMMIAHLPILVAACNSQADDTEHNAKFPEVVMVGLPYGAEEALSAACGLKKVAAMAFDTETPGLDRIEQFLPSIDILKAPWLAVAVSTDAAKTASQLIPTHIKQLKTTAPRNMNEAKKRRQLERRAAKEAQKTKAGVTRRVTPKRKVVISTPKIPATCGPPSTDVDARCVVIGRHKLEAPEKKEGKDLPSTMGEVEKVS